MNEIGLKPLPTKKRSRFKAIAIVLVSLIGTGFLIYRIALFGIEFDLHSSTTRYHETKDVAHIEQREKLYTIIGESNVSPEWMRLRAASLMGILECEREDYSKAQTWFIRSAEVKGGVETNPSKWSPPFSMVSFKEKSPAFLRGVQAELSRQAPPLSIDDESLRLDLPELPVGENAYGAFQEIEVFTATEKNAVNDLWKQVSRRSSADISAMLEICKQHRSKLEQAWNLPERLRLPSSADCSALYQVLALSQLLLIDSMSQKQIRNDDQSRQSFDTAYRLVGYLEQNPDYAAAAGAVGLKGQFNSMLLNTPIGQTLRGFFRESHQLPENFHERWVKGEYWVFKGEMKKRYEGGEDERALGLALQKNAVYCKGLVNGKGFTHFPNDKVKTKCLWFREWQKIRHLGAESTEEEGTAYALGIIDLSSTLIQSLAVLDAGRLEEAIRETRLQEKELLEIVNSSEQKITSVAE